MRYGTLPVLRSTGGLCDTVVDSTDRSIHLGTATAFTFGSMNSADMPRCIERALALYGQPLLWRKVQRRAMAQDIGWSESARRYLAFYHELGPQAVATSEAVTDDPIREKADGWQWTCDGTDRHTKIAELHGSHHYGHVPSREESR